MWPANETIVILYVRVFVNKIDDRVKPEGMPRRCSIQSIYTREKYLCKNLGVKEGGGHFFEGGVFLGTYSIASQL